MRIVSFIAVAGVVWMLLGSPPKDTADLIWPNGPAPWEDVDAFYYPDRTNLRIVERQMSVGTLDACRAWVRSAASALHDPQIRRGDFECGVGFLKDMGGGVRMYRLTVR